ncbi:MAG: hypothetical protein ACP5RT_00895 [Candidatus Micrarchaeia archaeon]
MDKKEIEGELERLKKELAKLDNQSTYPSDAENLFKYLVAEREKTNRILASITEKIKELEIRLDERHNEEITPENKLVEVPLSAPDSKIIEFIQTKELVCADDIKELMHYKGRNAACARLNKLYMRGLLVRYQLGHKVYYKFDAGKATNALIVSPPQ